MKTDECKDNRLFPARLYLSNTLKYHFYLPSHTLLCYLLSCVSKPFRLSLDHALTSHADGKVILLTCTPSLHLLLHLFLSLWLSGIVSQLSTKQTSFPLFLYNPLSILGLTETWIRPEDSATPAALSNNFSFSHTPRQVGRGGGTGLLISNNWKYSTHSPLCNYNSFESHAITVMAPIKLQIVVIYRPPGQILAPFLEELDGLLSSFMEDGTPLLVFGDFNIHLKKPYATDFHSLLASFDLKRLTTTSTHKSGNQLDLTHAIVLQITFWYNHYISLTISSLNSHYTLTGYF